MPKNVDFLFSFDPEKGEARQPPHAGLRAKLIIPDPELIGKKATFTIKRHVQVKDSRPVNDTEEMFKHKFTVRGGKVTVPIPHHVLDRTVETVDTGHAGYWGHPETIRARSYRSANSNSIGIMRRVKSRALSNSLLSESSCCW